MLPHCAFLHTADIRSGECTRWGYYSVRKIAINDRVILLDFLSVLKSFCSFQHLVLNERIEWEWNGNVFCLSVSGYIIACLTTTEIHTCIQTTNKNTETQDKYCTGHTILRWPLVFIENKKKVTHCCVQYVIFCIVCIGKTFCFSFGWSMEWLEPLEGFRSPIITHMHVLSCFTCRASIHFNELPYMCRSIKPMHSFELSASCVF